MHASIRIYPSLRDFDEAAQRVETGLVPILRGISGFRGYYAIECEGGVAVSVSLFDDEESARLSNARASAWGRENLADLFGRPPEMMAGRVRVAADPRARTNTARPGPGGIVCLRRTLVVGQGAGFTHEGFWSYKQASAGEPNACRASVLPADARAGRADFRLELGANRPHA